MIRFDGQDFHDVTRLLPQERAVALSIGGSTHAVMMASPDDLEDFAFGFLRGEGIIDETKDIEDITIVEAARGVDVQIRLRAELAEAYRAEKRARIGPVGCGLCGVESLELATPALRPVRPLAMDDETPFKALKTLQAAQIARQNSGAVHGAAILDITGKLLFAREDIGRHNALDKAIGAAMRAGVDLRQTLAVLSSRVSLDLIIKTVRAGIGVLIARASPSDLALEYAKQWGLRVCAPVFDDEYFCNGEGR